MEHEGVLSKQCEHKDTDYRDHLNHVVSVENSVLFHNTLFRSPFLHDMPLSHGDVLPAGTYLCFDGVRDVFLDYDTRIILPTQGMIYPGEEFCFIGKDILVDIPR